MYPSLGTDLNDLIRGLCFSKEKAELLASRLKQQNMVEKDVKVTYYKIHNRNFLQHSKLRDFFVIAIILKSFFKLWV